jgi:hypothetical protein
MHKTNWARVTKLLNRQRHLLHELAVMASRIEFGPHGMIHGEAQAYEIFKDFIETAAKANEERNK